VNTGSLSRWSLGFKMTSPTVKGVPLIGLAAPSHFVAITARVAVDPEVTPVDEADLIVTDGRSPDHRIESTGVDR
jgi:hypothetical protein